MAINTLDNLRFGQTPPEMDASLPFVGAQEAFEFTYGGRIPTYPELMALGSYVAEFRVERSSVDPSRPPVYHRQQRDETETMTADVFAPYQTVATPEHWLLSSDEHERLGAVMNARGYNELPRSRHTVRPTTLAEADQMLAEARTEAQMRLDLDGTIREAQRAARLEEVWATSRHAVRIGATTIGSTELAQLRQRSLQERMAAVNTSGPLPSEYAAYVSVQDAPAANTEASAQSPSRLRAAATAIGRTVSRLWRGVSGSGTSPRLA